MVTMERQHKFERHYREKAAKVPADMRKMILEERWIDSVQNVQEEKSPMGVLFDVYMMHVNKLQDMDDFSCQVCRQRVIQEWREMKPFLIELENAH